MHRYPNHTLHLLAVGVSVGLLIFTGCTPDSGSKGVPPVAEEIVATDDYLEVVNHVDDHVLEFVIGPFDMASDAGHLRLPIQKLETPFDLYGFGFEWEIRGENGQKLPDDLLHHMNIIDIDSRELFSPVARRVIASGRETSKVSLPKLVGIPMKSGHRLWIVSMFGNPTGNDYADARLHVRLNYTLPDEGIVPTVEVYPFFLDAAGFVGRKDWPVPPGRSEKSNIARPGADVKILGIGGHLHDYASELRLEDAATGEILWSGSPVVDEDGRTIGVSRDLLLDQLGIDLKAEREYRITVVHENPTDDYAPDGGMGSIAGVVTLSGDSEWPELDPDDPDYLKDLENTLLEPERMQAHGHGSHGGKSGEGHEGMDHGGMDHEGMDHEGMDHDGGSMDHEEMDHSRGDHEQD